MVIFTDLEIYARSYMPGCSKLHIPCEGGDPILKLKPDLGNPDFPL